MTCLQLGFGLPVSGSWATAPTMVSFARRAEELGYASLWAFQRLLHPADGDIGSFYRSVHDPVVALAHVAAVTERVRLGLAIVNLPFFSPILLAKQLTSLDLVSGGRLDAGLGLGWSQDEFAASGVAFERRGARADEFLACLDAIWGPDPASFEGKFYTVPPSLVDPKPAQSPHPPVLLGGGAEPSLRRAGRLADGWISASRHDLTRIGDAVATVRDAASDAGRDPDRLRFVVRGVAILDEERLNPDGRRRPLTGTEGQIRDDLAMLANQGITEVFLDPNFDPRIGSPDVDADTATALATRLLETFAPR